jgi:RED-like protein C-terminal region
VSDAYAECYPGFHEFGTTVVDSDEEDMSHMDKKMVRFHVVSCCKLLHHHYTQLQQGLVPAVVCAGRDGEGPDAKPCLTILLSLHEVSVGA